jgi:hypothetical protein
VDTKKRELVGNFKNNGSSWRREPIHVKDHDFPSDAIGKATPYGIYDTLQNQGFVSLGVSCDTPRFAVDAIETWWSCKGINQYADAKQIQVDALNNHDFSLQEYRFVQQSFYQALGVELFSYNIDQIAASASEGNFDMDMTQYENMQEQMNQIPEQNRELVSPYAEDAENWITFAWWGL